MTETNPARLHARIEGRVQGVGFRYFVRDQARTLGIKGWTRNRWDGSVEVVAEGAQEDLERLLSALRRGPGGSVVTGLTPDWEQATGEFLSFLIRHTG